MLLLSRNEATPILRAFVMFHTLVVIVTTYIFFESIINQARFIEWENLWAALLPVRWSITVQLVDIFNALFRGMVVYSSTKTILARLSIYAWLIELVFKVAYVRHRIIEIDLDSAKAWTLLTSKPSLLYYGGFLLVGLALKFILDELHDNDDRNLQGRREVVEGLDRDENYSVESSKTKSGTNEPQKDIVDPSIDEKDEDREPQTLNAWMRNLGLAQTLIFLLMLSDNWRWLQATRLYPQPGFVTAALLFNVYLALYGLYVVNRPSKRHVQALFYALICRLLIDIGLTWQGYTRFVGMTFNPILPTTISSLLGPLQRQWIYPNIMITFIELNFIPFVWKAVQYYKTNEEEKLQAANDDQQQ